jgi:hypothetical protein
MSLSSCSTVKLIFGNESPVEEKSNAYSVEDLSKMSPDWQRLQDRPIETGDVAYISKKDASIISLISECRQNSKGQDVGSASATLFYGVSEITYRQQFPAIVQDTPALQTIVQGTMDGNLVMLRSLALRHGSCLFDFIYIAQPSSFLTDEKEFANFIDSFRFA